MANIAFFHNALGKTDGVSLEVDKWRDVLRQMGHTVFYCAGNDDVDDVYCIEEMSFLHPRTHKILQNATVQLKDYDPESLKKEIFEQSEIIKKKLLSFIDEHNIEVVIPNNLLSVGYHIPALIAFSDVIRETGLKTINHNHDFYFEDSGEVNPTCEMVLELLDTYAPPCFENVQNLVINRIAQAELKERKKINASVVPNVFNFDQPQWGQDDYNSDFRKHFDIGENDIVLLQATRVMDRKGIELAIDVAASLNSSSCRERLYQSSLYDGRQFTKQDKIVLVCAGRHEKFGISENYISNLKKAAEQKQVIVKFIGEYVKHSRGMKQQKKVYSLWDCYVHADWVTYPSIWEGWGNQLIEAFFAKLPVTLFEYPVYVSDLKRHNFDVVSLGQSLSGKNQSGLVEVDPEVISRAAVNMAGVLTSLDRYKEMTDTNFTLSETHFSYQTLRNIISGLL